MRNLSNYFNNRKKKYIKTLNESKKPHKSGPIQGQVEKLSRSKKIHIKLGQKNRVKRRYEKSFDELYEESYYELLDRIKNTEREYQIVVAQNLKLVARIKYMERDAADVEHKRQETKLKRQRAVKKPLREVITVDQFQTLIKSLRNIGPSHDIRRARRIVAYFLLRLTGFRVSSLLLVTVGQIKEMFKNGETKLDLINGGTEFLNLLVPQNQREWFKGCYPEVRVLCEDKSEEDPLFHGNDRKKPMNKSHFGEDLNEPLKVLSKTVGAVLRTHSFRAMKKLPQE